MSKFTKCLHSIYEVAMDMKLNKTLSDHMHVIYIVSKKIIAIAVIFLTALVEKSAMWYIYIYCI